MKIINALSFRQKFGSVLDEVVRDREPITITRAGKPLVVLVPAEGYDQRGAARRHRLGRAVERLEAWRAAHPGGLGDADPVELLRRDRDDR